MSALKKQRIDLRLTDEDKNAIEEAAAMSNQTITQFMLTPLNVQRKLSSNTVA